LQLDLVPSLSRPGGNVTGATQLNVEVAPKRLELLHELIPTAKIVALLVNPTSPAAETLSGELLAAARSLGLQLHVLHAATERDFETVFATLVQLRAGGLVIASADPFFTGQREQLAALALRHAMPAIYQYREFAAAGGLMSYGGSIADTYRLAGVYTGRILKGEKPADLPVQQSTKVELIINLKTAKAFGITERRGRSRRARSRWRKFLGSVSCFTARRLGRSWRAQGERGSAPASFSPLGYRRGQNRPLGPSLGRETSANHHPHQFPCP
jgi:putative tryptophan/tyrosine transport system substrate-binding protein